MPDFKSGAVRANDINFHYLEMGHGPLVLCMHGFPDHAYSFRHLLPTSPKRVFEGWRLSCGGMRPPRPLRMAGIRRPC